MESKDNIRVHSIVNLLKAKIQKAAVFGSTLTCEEMANDIDLMIWADPSDYNIIKQIIRESERLDIIIEPFMCDYVELPEIPESDENHGERPIHICAVPCNGYENTSLWIRNKNQMLFLH